MRERTPAPAFGLVRSLLVISDVLSFALSRPPASLCHDGPAEGGAPNKGKSPGPMGAEWGRTVKDYPV